ncbi:hypothetical protein EV138_1657 [Kribbella voronezhensis]|uniref:DUF1989 domain-containing protein n=1 Tax=Kribbella voronezhensis TaxID=2512212 RepID=A0A4R7T9S7_9ACTN|nr:DUF1989 domain-containing protein [Kribbella voronezhensis]TDU88116.1 hypothetical protein EV138_1657 [Kribbella voronezhensis]
MSYQHELPGGTAWSFPVRAGRLIRLTALGPDANATMLLFGPDHLDRLNVPDTLKAQMSACIRPPMVLMSDRGLALASVTASTLDWHDCLTGFRQDQLLFTELAKHGLGEADLHASINFFSKVAIADDTRLAYSPGHAAAGDTVDLRTEQDVLVVISTAPHPLSHHDPASVRVEVTAATEVHRPQRDEAARALEMSRRTLV